MGKTKVILEVSQDEFFTIKLALANLIHTNREKAANMEFDGYWDESNLYLSACGQYDDLLRKLRRTAKYEYTKVE